MTSWNDLRYFLRMSLEKQIRSFLKQTLRQREITYSELADELKVSEPTVKRLMAGQRISINDLEKICLFLGISPTELLQMANKDNAEFTTLTYEQEEFLCLHPKIDYLFMRITFGFKVDQVAQDLNFSEIETENALCKLEKIGLIKVGKKRNVLIRKRSPFHWIPDGPFEKKYRFSFLRAASLRLEELLFLEKPGSIAEAFELYLCQENQDKLVREIKELISRYKKITKIDQVTTPVNSLRPMTVLLGATQFNTWEKILVKSPTLAGGRNDEL